MKALLNWIGDRTGLAAGWRLLADAPIPGGASWLRVWPTTILFALAVQGITGFFLWCYYSPSAQTAWESVYYLETQVAGGWLLRAIHHYMAQLVIVLAGIYVLQMIVTRSFRAPRELIFWVAVFMGLLSLGSALTGDLLAWDQNSYASTQVRVNFAKLLPVVGGDLFKIAAGGPSFGHLTLTRFMAMHVSLFAAGMIGLYLLFIVATIAIVATRFWLLDDPNGYILTICRTTFVLTVLGAVFILALLIPGLTEGRLSKALGRLPRIGHTVESVIDAVRMYRRKPGVLFGASLMSVGVHSFFAAGVYLIARGLFGNVLSLGQHFVVMPLSAVTGVLPLPLGPFELVLEFFYTQVPTAGFIVPTGQGLVVALGYRLICILIAAIGYGYYLSSRREITRAMREAELQQQSDSPLLAQAAPADSQYADHPRLDKVAGTPA